MFRVEDSGRRRPQRLRERTVARTSGGKPRSTNRPSAPETPDSDTSEDSKSTYRTLSKLGCKGSERSAISRTRTRTPAAGRPSRSTTCPATFCSSGRRSSRAGAGKASMCLQARPWPGERAITSKGNTCSRSARASGRWTSLNSKRPSASALVRAIFRVGAGRMPPSDDDQAMGASRRYTIESAAPSPSTKTRPESVNLSCACGGAAPGAETAGRSDGNHATTTVASAPQVMASRRRRERPSSTSSPCSRRATPLWPVAGRRRQSCRSTSVLVK